MKKILFSIFFIPMLVTTFTSVYGAELPTPYITSITPSSGFSGTSVVIHGSDFTTGSWVNFNGYRVKESTVEDPYTIIFNVPLDMSKSPNCYAPPGADCAPTLPSLPSGSYMVYVVSPAGGVSATSNKVTFTVGTQGVVTHSTTTTTPASNATTQNIFIKSNLFLGISGAEVKALQQILIKDGELAPEYATGYFGRITMSAVIKFQQKYSIPATGFVGPLTRGKLGSI